MYEIFAQLLEQRNLKAADVCKGTGLPSSLFSEWKRGKSTPKADKMKKIADYFGVSTDYLMTGKKDIDLRIDGLTGFQALLADIYGSCKLESAMGKYGECLYFSVGTGKSRYALEETDFDRLYHSVKKTVQQMTNLLLRNETIVRYECQKVADTPPTPEEIENSNYLNAAHADDYNNAPEELKREEDEMINKNFSGS